MKDIEILQQLLNGNHLEPDELERAKKIVLALDIQIDNRLENF